METTSTAVPVAKLLLPHSRLSGCIFGAFVRDIRECDLTNDRRFNHFAASPLCSITWTFDGSGHLLTSTKENLHPSNLPAFPAIAFSGAYQSPQTSWSYGNFYAMTLALYPDAFSTLSGIDPAEYANQTVPVEEVLSGDMFEWVRAVAATGEAERGFQITEEKLGSLWFAMRPTSPLSGHLVSDWCRSLLLRAAISDVGKSTRQIERRFKSWTGHSKQRLLAFIKSETAFEHALNSRKKGGELKLADMAADLGYSDQSHMGRRVKEITGFSPAEFLQRYDDDETFWSFRLMGTRF